MPSLVSQTSTVALAVLLGVGCRVGTYANPPADRLTDRVWVRTDPSGLPGVMRIFLSDGTLLMDSCWETYRLARWQRESDTAIRWREDAADLRAAIRALDDSALVLAVSLRGGEEEQHYTAAPIPYVCPDMPR